MSLARCIYSCEDNSDCEAACVDQFKLRTEDCPCEVCTYYIIIIHRFRIKNLFRVIARVDVHATRLSAKMSLQQSLQQLRWQQLHQNRRLKKRFLCLVLVRPAMFQWSSAIMVKYSLNIFSHLTILSR